MLLENLESRTLLAGDGSQSEDVNPSAETGFVITKDDVIRVAVGIADTVGRASTGLAIAKDAAIGAVHGYFFPATLGLVVGGALGVAGGVAIGSAIVVTAEGISSVMHAFSPESNDDASSQSEGIFMESIEGWGVSVENLEVIIGTAIAGTAIGAVGASLKMSGASSWSPFASETQNRVFAGAAGGAVMGAILHL